MMKKYKFYFLTLGLGLFLISASISYDRYFEITKNMEIFANLYKEINANYVDQTDPSKLMKVGIDAMLNTLDPFTNYITESQIENYRINVEGKYNGIGARAKKIGDYVTVTEIYKDYPAYKAGLHIGDEIVAVNGLDAKGKDSEDLYQIMRGTPKSEVTVTVRRPGANDKLDLKIIRDEVNIPNVPYSGMLSDDIGYITLTTFTENAGKNVQSAFKKLKDEHPTMKGLIFDLRDNGGGLLHEAVDVCNTFVPQGQLIASTRSKNKDTDLSYKTLHAPSDANIPVVVLINSHSASASEIVSGSLQDLDRAVLLGQISYGKGLVQNTKDVGYSAKVKLTTAKYYIPSGRCIQSVKYENGVPVHLPDSLRAAFKTTHNRIVYDGGGVRPDIELKDAGKDFTINKLVDDNWIFKYSTGYLMNHKLPENAEDFHFTEFDQFVKYLKDNQFDDQSTLEKKLEELETNAKATKLESIYNELADIKKTLAGMQWDTIEKNKELIINLIEQEIVGRGFYEEGKLKKKLGFDPWVKEAISLLNNPEKYNSLLK